MNKPYHLKTDDPIWSVPQSILDRVNLRQENSEYTQFMMAGLFSMTGLCFLIFFGVAALFRNEMHLANVLFGFSFATVFGFFLIWFSSYLFLAKHLIVLLLGSMCVYLFYSGGSEGTGPLYFLLFPLFAIFLQDYRVGAVSVAVLMLVTMAAYSMNLYVADYEFYFLTRVLAIYIIISLLAVLSSYFRYVAERELMLSYEDIEQISYADQLTGMANRNLMEKLLSAEAKRFVRYQSNFCVMLLSLDSFNSIQDRLGREFSDSVLQDLGEIFKKILRNEDIPSRWERDEFLIMLLETDIERARIAGERLRQEIARHEFYYKGQVERITASIGVKQMEGEKISYIIQQADINLSGAVRQSGNCVVISE